MKDNGKRVKRLINHARNSAYRLLEKSLFCITIYEPLFARVPTCDRFKTSMGASLV